MSNRNRAIEEAEITVLAVLLNDSYAIVPVMGVLAPEDFSSPAHAAIYSAVLDCMRAQVVPNINTVASRLPSVSIDTLKEIARHFNTKANKEVLYVADVVKTAATVRRVQEAAGEIVTEANKAPSDLEGFVNYSVTMLTQAIEGRVERDPSITAVLGRLDSVIAEASKGVRGVPTGLHWLDQKTGGLAPSHVWMIAAAYKQRKTTLMRNLVLNACRAGASVDVFALEGDEAGTSAGLWAMMATGLLLQWGCDDQAVIGETYVELGSRSQAQKEALDQARKEFETFNLRIYDGRHGVGDFAKLALKVKRDKFMFGLQVFALDYLQKMRGDGKLYDRVERNTHALQDLISSEGITGVILAQLNEGAVRAGDDDDYSPGVKGGGDPAAAADFLIRTIYDGENTPDELTVHLKLARHSQPGKQLYEINPQSGLILGPSPKKAR